MYRLDRSALFSTTIRVGLGLVLVAAGVVKGHALTVGEASSGPFLPSWMRITLVVLECSFGLWLILGFAPEATRLVALACFATFGLISARGAFLGESSCGCFGATRVDPRVMVVFDLAAVGLLLTSRPRPGRSPNSNRQALLWFATLAGWVGVLWGIAVVPREPPLLIASETFAGRCLPILNRIDVGDQLTRGTWTIVFFRHDCATCRKEIPGYEKLARGESGRRRFALIELPTIGLSDKIPIAEGSTCLFGKMAPLPNWIIHTPTEIRVQDCIVQP